MSKQGKTIMCPAYQPDERAGRGGPKGKMDQMVQEQLGATGVVMRDITDFVFEQIAAVGGPHQGKVLTEEYLK